MDEAQKQLSKKSLETGAEVNTDFMKEQIKQRPVSRRRLLRRTLTTGLLGILFGAIACFAFLFLEPYLSNMLYPPAQTVPITFPEETAEEEMSPQEMIADDQQIVEEAAEAAEAAAAARIEEQIEAQIREQIEAQSQTQQVDAADIERQVREVLQQQTDNIDTYEKTYNAMSVLASEASRSLTAVAAVSSDTNWFNDAYESSGVTTGLVVARTSEELLVLAKDISLLEADRILITFYDGSEAQAQLKSFDKVSGFEILAVSSDALEELESGAYAVAELGSSISPNLIGDPVIAVGAPYGTQGSVGYGVISAAAGTSAPSDAVYRILTTNIYGSTGASGVLVSLRGRVIGFIDMSYAAQQAPNLISAIGITELKPVIERLSNDQPIRYLGVHGEDLTEDISKESGLPIGAYITKIDMDSPAMDAGIQSGDVITAFGERTIASYTDLIAAIGESGNESEVTVLLSRPVPDGNAELELTVSFE